MLLQLVVRFLNGEAISDILIGTTCVPHNNNWVLGGLPIIKSKRPKILDSLKLLNQLELAPDVHPGYNLGRTYPHMMVIYDFDHLIMLGEVPFFG